MSWQWDMELPILTVHVEQLWLYGDIRGRVLSELLRDCMSGNLLAVATQRRCREWCWNRFHFARQLHVLRAVIVQVSRSRQ